MRRRGATVPNPESCRAIAANLRSLRGRIPGRCFDSSASFVIYEEIMSHPTTRRDAFIRMAGGALLAGVRRGRSATTKGPHDFIIVEGHYDIWEISARTRLPGE